MTLPLSHSVQLARAPLCRNRIALLATLLLARCAAREPETAITVDKEIEPSSEPAQRTPLLLESYTAVTGEKLDRKELIETASRLIKRQRNRTAIACLNDSLKLEPRDLKALEMRARCLDQTGQLAEALIIY